MSHATVCLGFDFDAVSVWIHGFEALDSPTRHSRGVYGAEVGVPRLLDLLDEFDIEATFFTPGHTIESFPDAAGAIHDRGHDIQHHGWSHTSPSEFESRAAERADVERGIECIRDLTGRPPEGYRSPDWDFSRHTLDILRELGFEWDSSQMGRDFEPYYLRTGWSASPADPYDPGERTEILELPVSWSRDDWPAFQFVMGDGARTGTPDEKEVFDAWSAQFDWMYDHVDGGVFSLTFHPQIIARPPRVRYLRRLLGHIQEKPNVAFETYADVAASY